MTGNDHERSGTMQDMKHAIPDTPRRDHLWVLVIIAACCLLEVWASWVTIGSMSGFPKIGGKHGLPTDWTLAVTTEAYWGYALYAWLAASPGRRSRTFAMWSAGGVFLLSLIGQGAAHLVKPGTQPPAEMVVFVTALPVIVLALIAILVHLRQLDREEAEEVVRRKAAADRQAVIKRAEADERTALRAALEAAGAEREAMRVEFAEIARRAEAERDAAVSRLAEAEAKAEVLARKLAAASGRNKTRKRAGTSGQKNAPETGAGSPPEVEVPEDVDTQAAALEILAKNPDISGSELGRRLGKTERYGCMLKKQLAGSVAGPDAQ